MPGVFDQLNWQHHTDGYELLQLVSDQLDTQESIRQRIRQQLVRDYPPTALAWLSTVTWSPATLVPLSSFDLRGIKEWPTWQDKRKLKTFTEKIESGWHKPIVAIKLPGGRYLIPIDGHTRLTVYYSLKRPVLAWVGKTHSVHGEWEVFHDKQRGMTSNQQKTEFTTVHEQLLIELDAGSVLTEQAYQELLLARRTARSQYESGHPERIAAERSVRLARKQRKSVTL